MNYLNIAKKIMGWEEGAPKVYSLKPCVEYIKEIDATLITHDGINYTTWNPREDERQFESLLARAQEKGLIYVTVPIDQDTREYRLTFGFNKWLFTTYSKELARHNVLAIIEELARTLIK